MSELHREKYISFSDIARCLCVIASESNSERLKEISSVIDYITYKYDMKSEITLTEHNNEYIIEQ